MPHSIRTEFEIEASDACPVASASAQVDTTINQVVRPTFLGSDGTLVEQFAVDAEVAIDNDGFDKVFESESHDVYQFARDGERRCICATIERRGCPVTELRARDGRLYVSLYAPNLDTIRDILTDLNEWVETIQIRKLTRAADHSTEDFVFVDRSQLTDRQLEVLETSFEMGYFEYPRRSNAGEVAEELGIAPSTFIQHLAAVQRKMLEPLTGN